MKDVTVGELLSRIRISKKLQQKDVASSIGINAATLSRIERNQVRVTLGRLPKLAKAYGLTRKQEKQLTSLIVSRPLKMVGAPLEMQIFSQLMQLPKNIRQKIIAAAVAYDSI